MKCYHCNCLLTEMCPAVFLGGLAWRLSYGCTKSLSHPEAPCVNTKRVTVCRLPFYCSLFVWLGWVLFISRDPLQREETMLSVESVCLSLSFSLSLVCLWLPLWVRLLDPTQNTNQPVSFQTPLSFYFSLPSSLRSSKLTVPRDLFCLILKFLVPWSTSTT